LIKKLDPEARLEMHTIMDPRKADQSYVSWDEARELLGQEGVTSEKWNALTPDERKAHLNDAYDRLKQQRAGLSVPSLKITPRLRETIKAGLPMFADGGVVELAHKINSGGF
jgi:hypothetical protein